VRAAFNIVDIAGYNSQLNVLS